MADSSVTVTLEQAHGALGLLNDAEKPDAARLLSLWEAYLEEGEAGVPDLRREVGRLVEILARRSASAMPYAALGRALLADAAGSPRMAEDLLGEFRNKLLLLGM